MHSDISYSLDYIFFFASEISNFYLHNLLNYYLFNSFPSIESISQLKPIDKREEEV
mgnify:CR=1 FL=1